ncbi:MAG: hypothetical protein FWC45_08605, partial [Treponema sp.]|nr:hypothetical protein [Treponema sp.]
MKKYGNFFLCVLIILLPALPLQARDFGLLLDQTAGYGGFGSDGSADYSGLLIPRFSALLGDNGAVYVSAAFRADYQSDTWTFAPELLRTEFSWRFDNGELQAGRMQYSDPLGFIANGLFDGARFSLDTAAGTFSIGAWYTGLLYKKRLEITMTSDDLQSNYTALDYGDFLNTYFAPRRIVSALGWEHPGIGDIFRVNAALLGQFDVSGGDRLHSQYVTGKVTAPYKAFLFNLGGCLELTERSGDVGVGLAGELGAAWFL